MPALPSPQEIARTEIAVMTEIFAQTRDASAAWRAFHLARKYSVEIPAAIHAEIDRFAEAIGKIAETAAGKAVAPTVKPEKIGKIWKGHKGRDAGTGVFLARRAYLIAVEVERLRRSGMSSANAVNEVRKKHRVNKTLVEDAMRLHAVVKFAGNDELGALW